MTGPQLRPRNPKETIMQKITVAGAPLMLGSGEIALLTPAQLATRRHNVEVLDQGKDGAAKIRVLEPLTFKVGETLTLERVPKGAAPEMREQTAAPAKEDKKPSKKALQGAYDEGFEAGKAAGVESGKDALLKARSEARAELLDEIAARNDVIDALEAAQAAEEALGSDATDEQRAEAKAAVEAAQAAVDALQPLEA